MANFYADDFNQKPLHLAEYGNAWAEDYSASAEPKVSDKVYLGIIPAGVRVYDVSLSCGANQTSSTADLGFEPVEDSPSADGDYWISAADVENAYHGRSEADPITFDKPVRLVLKAAGADHSANTYKVVVYGKVVGIR